eukprot:gene11917-12061_t
MLATTAFNVAGLAPAALLPVLGAATTRGFTSTRLAQGLSAHAASAGNDATAEGPMLLDSLHDDARLNIEEFVQKLTPRYQQHFLHKAPACEVEQPERVNRVKSDQSVAVNSSAFEEMRRVRLLTTINYHH